MIILNSLNNTINKIIFSNINEKNNFQSISSANAATAI